MVTKTPHAYRQAKVTHHYYCFFSAVGSLATKIQIVILYILSIVFGKAVSAWSDNLEICIYLLETKEAGETRKYNKSAYTNQYYPEEFLALSKEVNTVNEENLTSLGKSRGLPHFQWKANKCCLVFLFTYTYLLIIQSISDPNITIELLKLNWNLGFPCPLWIY